ncbi:aspartate aminotransferase family protein [Salipiger sp. PrR002]|uniref:aminotransferase family protein n=1 Tax=Salipiger sp. PrR002 TaxID=2706489 RepID=UPI0013B73101|nr:aminotransferase class III-fold pyridoxal phosphate-dependent enzyme [Salipiger sp. PrR002]NDW01909.1 aspartate aminotransferase family protein [Salipiger sp. PrR002]NDW59061.1 aspartate aminotransferase family protein [Salipiger sp. PrR004]
MTQHAERQWLEDFEGRPVPDTVVTGGRGGWLTIRGEQPAYEAVSGHSCLNLGHGNPELLAVASEALARLSYCSPEEASVESLDLARRLSALLGGDYMVKYALSGASANEVALSIARGNWIAAGRPEKRICLALDRSYHGQIGAATDLTGFPAFKGESRGDGPEVVHVASAYDSETGKARPLDALCAQLERDISAIGADRIACLFVEPVNFAGGVIVPPEGYLKAVREICSRHDILLVVDEIITGFGRTGAWFGFQHEAIRPDIVTMAKGLTAGYFPLGAVAVDRGIYDRLNQQNYPLRKVITMAGHPVGCSIAIKAIEIVERDGLIGRVRESEAVIKAALHSLVGAHIVKAVRGKGHLWGIEFAQCGAHAAAEIAERISQDCRKRRCIVAAADGIIRINPPLNMSAEERSQMLAALCDAVQAEEKRMTEAGVF